MSTQATLDLLDQSLRKPTQVEALAAFFQARPNQWIPALELMPIGGWLRWRTSVSDARRLFRMDIKNRQVYVDGKKYSEYRYVKAAA